MPKGSSASCVTLRLFPNEAYKNQNPSPSGHLDLWQKKEIHVT